MPPDANANRFSSPKDPEEATNIIPASKEELFMEFTIALLAVILLATLVQYLVDIVKGIIPAESIGSLKLPPIYAAIIGIALTVLTLTV